MIKQTTVIKRMIQDGWKPVTIIVATIAAISAGSVIAEKAFGIDSGTVYFSSVALWFLLVGIKWAYEMKRDQIAYEQKEMLRDLERKHL